MQFSNFHMMYWCVVQVFDSGLYESLCYVLLIYGEAESSEDGTMYVGPCVIPSKVESLILIVSRFVYSTDLFIILQEFGN